MGLCLGLDCSRKLISRTNGSNAKPAALMSAEISHGWCVDFTRVACGGGPVLTRVVCRARRDPRTASERGCYRSTSLIRNCPSLGPYSGTMPRALW